MSAPERVTIRLARKEGCGDLPLPAYMSPGASGMDLCASVETQTTLARGKTMLVPTGLYLSIPHGYEAQVRPRSGLALKHGVTVLNTPGTIDSDYRGEVGIILANFGEKDFVIERGMRIAQLVIQRVESADFVEVEALSDTERGLDGFGSTGR